MRNLRSLRRSLGLLVLALTILLPMSSLYAQDNTPIRNEPCAAPSWLGEFYDNTTFTGPSRYIVCRRLIDFYWGGGSPFEQMHNENFSSRWRTVAAFPTAGTYLFTVRVHGGAALYINGTPVINDLNNGSRTLTATYTTTTPGEVLSLQLDSVHFNGPTQLFLEWSLVAGGASGAVEDHRVTLSTPFSGFSAGGGNVWFIEHFNNTSVSGAPGATNIHAADGISYDYQYGPPEPEILADGFSSRWTRTVDFVMSATYTFYVRANDAARLYVDGQLVVPDTANGSGSITLLAGRHTIVVEHYDSGDAASIFVTWDPPVGTMLFPDGCNAIYTAGVDGNAPLCPERGIATFTYIPSVQPAGEDDGSK